MKRFATPALLAALLLVPAGCGWFDDPSPDDARLFLEGETGTPVRVITSVSFVAGITDQRTTRVEILSADTAVVDLPFQRTYTIRDHQRFFVEAARLDADLQDFHMQVMIDDEDFFDDAGPLVDGEPYRFVYLFNQRVTRVIDVEF